MLPVRTLFQSVLGEPLRVPATVEKAESPIRRGFAHCMAKNLVVYTFRQVSDWLDYWDDVLEES